MTPSTTRSSAGSIDVTTLLAQSAARRIGLAEPRWQALLAALPFAADSVSHRRASCVAEADLDDYVSLQWMRWNGGSIELTEFGRNLMRAVDTHPIE